eukprot:COSAG01_NODE_205_length_22070_cov_106.423877_2_plen_167_part_00
MRIEVSEYLEEDETSILYGVRVLILRILPDCTSSRFSAAFSEKSARDFSQLPRDLFAKKNCCRKFFRQKILQPVLFHNLSAQNPPAAGRARPNCHRPYSRPPQTTSPRTTSTAVGSDGSGHSQAAAVELADWSLRIMLRIPGSQPAAPAVAGHMAEASRQPARSRT